MVVQLAQPCRVRYRRRSARAGAPRARDGRDGSRAGATGEAPIRITVDRDLCQGHGDCVLVAPEAFEVDPVERKVRLRIERPDDALRERVAEAVRRCPTGALSIDAAPPDREPEQE
jgi:sterol 14-demethylase